MLTWDGSDSGFDPDWYEQVVNLTSRGRHPADRWSVGSRKNDVEAGTRVYLLRQQTRRGLVGSGYVLTGEVFQAPHWERPRETANYVDVNWDVLVPLDERLTAEDLAAQVPEVDWRYGFQASGNSIAESASVHLEQVWRAHTGRATVVLPGEEGPAGPYREGGLARVEVNRYERDPAARRACIDAHGYACTVCGFDFERTYGDLGREYVVVHHVVELSTLGADYEIDPIKDLVPLCANCHAMLHRQRPALSPDVLRQCLINAN